MEPPDDLSCLTTLGRLSQRRAVARAVDQVHPDAHSESMPGLPTPALTCARADVCICRIIFLTGASNNHNDSFPFVISFASLCDLHQFRRATSALPCYLPLCFPIPLPSLLCAPRVRPVLGGKGRRGNVLLWGRGWGEGGLPPSRTRRPQSAPAGQYLLTGTGQAALVDRGSPPVKRQPPRVHRALAPRASAVWKTKRSILFPKASPGRGLSFKAPKRKLPGPGTLGPPYSAGLRVTAVG